MVFSSTLLYFVQLILAGGVPSVFLLVYATRNLFIPEEGPRSSEPHFASEYDELMWLAEKQNHARLSPFETRRFYELRDGWQEMHGGGPQTRDPSDGGTTSEQQPFAAFEDLS